MNRLLLLFSLLILPVTGFCTVIQYDATNLSGNSWQYDYTITNDSLTEDIEEFSIYFDYDLYENLSLVSNPIGWDPLIIQSEPSLFVPDDGLFDSLALVSGISPGEILGGFSIMFDWLGTDTPANQFFEILDFNFNVIDSGFTQTSTPNDIPEPSILILILSGFALLAMTRRKNHYQENSA